MEPLTRIKHLKHRNFMFREECQFYIHNGYYDSSRISNIMGIPVRIDMANMEDTTRGQRIRFYVYCNLMTYKWKG